MADVIITYTDPATEGVVVNLMLLRDDGMVRDFVAASWVAARSANTELAMTELTGFLGTHRTTVTILDAEDQSDITVRFEDAADVGSSALGAGPLFQSTAGSGGEVSGDHITLTTLMPGTDIGSGEINFGSLCEEILAVAKGRQRIDRDARTMTFYHLDGTTLRTLNLEETADFFDRRPPGA